MKTRNGFVSNSSSSSFIINASDFSLEKVKDYVEKLVEAENLLNDTNLTSEYICTIYEVEDMDEITCDVYNYTNYKAKMTLAKYKVSADRKEAKKGIRIDSNGDNSIPWTIQEALENLGKRYHWG